MATNNLQENLKKYFYSGVGLAAHTAEVVQKSVNELVKKGKVSEADGKRIVGEAIRKVETRRPELEAKYNEAVHKFVKMTSSEVGKLQKRIEKLEGQLKAGSRSSSSRSAAARPAAKKKSAKKRSRPSRAASSASTASESSAGA